MFSVHLKNEQVVYFSSNISFQKLKRRKKNIQIRLMIYFKYNIDNFNNFSRFYIDFFVHFIWNIKSRFWKFRQQKLVIIHIHHVNSIVNEKFWLQFLLMIVPKTKLFKQLYWIDDVQFLIYWFTCVERGFAKNDEYWYHCFDDNIIHAIVHQLRLLFVIDMLTDEISDPRVIWNKYNEHFFDNFFHHIEQKKLQFSQFLTNFYHDYSVYFFRNALKKQNQALQNCHLFDLMFN